MNYDLLRSQRNTLLELVRKSKLDPFSFEWTTRNSTYSYAGDVPVLEYVGTDYYCVFDQAEGDSCMILSPGNEKSIELYTPSSWEKSLVIYKNWLDFLYREIKEPDLWDAIKKQQFNFPYRGDPSAGNTLFTVPEQKRIENSINSIRNKLHQLYSDSTESQLLISNKLDYIITASERQGRYDWFNTTLGIFATLNALLNIPSDQLVVIFNTLRDGVNGIVNLIGSIQL